MTKLRAPLLAFLVIGCGQGAPPKREEIAIRGMAFDPARLEVAVGDTVAWTDFDLVPHSATSDSVGAWEVGPILQGGAGTFVPTAAGTFRYHCRFHPTMGGTLVVVAQR